MINIFLLGLVSLLTDISSEMGSLSSWRVRKISHQVEAGKVYKPVKGIDVF